MSNAPHATEAPRRRWGIAASIATVAAISIVSVADASAPDRRPAPTITTDESGRWSVVGGRPDAPLATTKGDDPSSAAAAALRGVAAGLRIDDPGRELREVSARSMPSGGTTIRFSQTVSGIPVFAGGAAVRLDANNAALSVTSSAIATSRTKGLHLTPSVDPSSARRTALAATARELPRASTVTTSTPQKVVYDPTMIAGDPNGETMRAPRLAWSILVSDNNHAFRNRVLVDAIDGAVLLNFSEIPDALSRSVCDYNNTATPGVCRTEGDPAPAGYDDLNHAYDFLGESYQYLADQFGRDGYDNAGSVVTAETRVCPTFSPACPYWNAYWYGSGMVLGQGFSNADDVVGHEYVHGVTQYEADLMYYAESGAINESMSDVFGELIDWTYDDLGTDTAANRWLMGEDFTTIRSMSNPPAFGHPDRVLSPNYHVASSDNYGVHINSGVNNKAAFLMVEGGAFNGYTVAPLGPVKTAAIYYEALTALLTPGSDYLDLFGILPQACTNLVGIKGIVNADCAEVGKVVAATEMDRVTTRRRTTANTCSQGTRTVVFSDNVENGLGKWVTNSGAGAWSSSTRAAQSGTRALWGPSLWGTDQYGPGFSNWIRTRYKVAVPASGQSYLWFDHSFNLEQTWDGGVIEYSTNGTTWTDLGSQVEANGYTGQLDVSANPLTGRSAFTGQSRGFQQTRVALAGLAGQSVYLRFLIGADATVAADGWFVDDVMVYNCATAVTTTTSSTTAPTTTTRPTTTTTTTAPTTTTTRPSTTTTTSTSTTSPPVETGFSSGYQPITPQRLIDTRSDAGMVNARGVRPAGSVLRFNARSLGIYRDGHTATALNLTVTMVGNTAAGHVTVYPCGTRPTTSTLNATTANVIVVNTATIPLSAIGELCIYNHAATHLIVDVAGYQTSTRGSIAPSRYRPVAPRRLVDTRNTGGLVPVQGRRSAGSMLTIDAAKLGIFAAGTTPRALDLTVTVANNDGPGHVTAYPCGKRPTTTVLNTHRPNQVVSNTATVPLSGTGTFCVYTHSAGDLIIDVSGYYSPTAGPVLSTYQPVAPKRVVDTRNDNGLFKTSGVRTAGSTLKINLHQLGIHKSGRTPTAYDLNFTMVLNQQPGHLTAYPCGKKPTAATMTAATTQMIIGNTATVPVNANGEICIYTHAATHLTVDVTGYHYT